MKHRILYPLALVLLTGCLAESVDLDENIIAEKFESIQTRSTNGNTYYWHNDSKVYITETDDVFVILKENALKHLNSDIQTFQIVDDELASTQSNMTASNDVYTNIYHYGMRVKFAAVNDLGEDVIYYAPYYLLPTGKVIGLSELFLVKLKKSSDYSILEDFANQHNVNIVKNMSRPLWYKLSCSINSAGNALQMANMAYESGLFAASEAIFINNLTPNTDSYNDPEYFRQWNIRANNSYSINMGGVHNITSGENDVMVAVIDAGFQLDHPDIDMNSGWDATHRSIGARLYEYNKESYTCHGTGTAGIIGAKSNNNTGIVGIAPNVTIFPISVHMDSTAYRSSHDAMVDAIDYAVARGADIISNSWSLETSSQYIKEAVEDALEYGRNGKGSVVVFASGNYSSQESRYPHAEIPDIISVGNTNSYGYRQSTSNYGPDLDLVAPGTSIRTLKPGSSYYSATGTSFSCPHVSAIAALMLSANQDLTQSEIGYILDITATKIDTYDFIANPSKPNGIWNNQVGYGLVNCYDAVMQAYYYNEDNYTNLIEFDHTGQELELSLTVKDDIAVIWDWDNKDITYISASATSPVDTTLTHLYASSKTRHIIVAETVAPNETTPSSSSALTEFDLTIDNLAGNFEIKPINSALKYLRIIGGPYIPEQTITINNMPALEQLYIVNMKNSRIFISNCPNLRTFGTSRYLWVHSSSGGTQAQSIGNDTVDPNIVIGDVTLPKAWPDIPETVMTPSLLSISNCPMLTSLSLENVGFTNFSFSGLNRLLYVYLSSQASRIVGAGTSSLLTPSFGYYLNNAIATLPARTSSMTGKIVIRAVNTSSTEFIPVDIAVDYKTSIQNYCNANYWNLVWDSGIN